MRSLSVLAIALTFVSSVHAQKVTVGPSQSAPVLNSALHGDTYQYWQSILIPTSDGLRSGYWTRLRLRFFFDGAIIGNDNYHTNVSYGTGDPWDLPNYFTLDQNVHGWVEWNLRNPGRAGDTFWLLFSSDWSLNYWEACLAGDPTCTWAQASIRLTEADTYVGGYFSCGDPSEPCESEPGDLAFQAQFSETPEPMTLILLGTGIAGLGAVALRKRRNK